MFRRKAFLRLTALFVVGFICLNAGGALCVAYCQTFDLSAEKEHCPVPKDDKHSDRAQAVEIRDLDNSDIDETDCCPMTVSFVAGPIEKHSLSFNNFAEVAEKVTATAFVPACRGTFSNGAFNYRGPPLDRRVDRLKNCIIRI